MRLVLNYGEKGDLLFEISSDFFQFQTEPQYKIDSQIVKIDTKFFKEFISGWEEKEDIYYINIYGDLVSDKFDTYRHTELVKSGNAFKSFDFTKKLQKNIKELLSGDLFLLTDDDLNELKSLSINEDYKKLVQKINDIKDNNS